MFFFDLANSVMKKNIKIACNFPLLYQIPTLPATGIWHRKRTTSWSLSKWSFLINPRRRSWKSFRSKSKTWIRSTMLQWMISPQMINPTPRMSGRCSWYRLGYDLLRYTAREKKQKQKKKNEKDKQNKTKIKWKIKSLFRECFSMKEFFSHKFWWSGVHVFLLIFTYMSSWRS